MKMSQRLKILFFTLICFTLCPPAYSSSRSRAVAIGGSFSPKSIGLTLEIPNKKEDALNTFIIGADLFGVINGRYQAGYKIEYFLNYDIISWKGNEGLSLSLFAGPGAMAGFVRDREKNPGLSAGLCADIGVSFSFPSSVKISVGFSAGLAYHISKLKGSGHYVTFYKNGVYMSPYPVIGIVYIFR